MKDFDDVEAKKMVHCSWKKSMLAFLALVFAFFKLVFLGISVMHN